MSNSPHLVIVTILWERSSIICHRWKSTNMVARKCAFPNVQSIFDYQTHDYNDYKKIVLEVTETLYMKTSYNQTKTWTQNLPELTFYFKNLIIQCKGCHWSIARFKNWLCCHINLLCWIMVPFGSYELCFSMRLQKMCFDYRHGPYQGERVKFQRPTRVFQKKKNESLIKNNTQFIGTKRNPKPTQQVDLTNTLNSERPYEQHIWIFGKW